MASVAQVISRIQQKQRDIATLQRQAGALIGDLNEAARVHRIKSAQLLDNEARRWVQSTQELEEAGVADWDSPFWDDYTSDGALLRSIRIGCLIEQDLLEGERGLHGAPAVIPFLEAEGALIVVCDGATQADARALIQSMILRTAIAMPGDIRYTLIDRGGMGEAFPMRSRLPKVRQSLSGQSIANELNAVEADISRINSDVLGRRRLIELTAQERAGEQFEVIAAMDFPEEYRNDPRAVDLLVKVGSRGPKTGRHLLLEVRGDKPMPRDFVFDRFEKATYIDLRPGRASIRADAPPDPAWEDQLFASAKKTSGQTRAATWSELIRPKHFFAETSVRRVETPIGERLAVWLGDSDDGKPSAHAMIAGQTGSGKSYLLHVLITGLAARYSPDELQLYLIDGKQGVEFNAYQELPHARVVSLETSPEMARSVLEDFVAEMKDRYAQFKSAGDVANLELFRRATGQRTPRILLVVDEYQQLLEGDPERGARLLNEVLEKGRAAGTHLVLGSQTFNVRGLPSTAMSHVHLRVALSLAQDYVQGIQAFGTEGKRFIRELAPSGEVVINHSSGADGANKRGAIARLPSTTDGAHALTDAVADIVGKAAASPGRRPPPIVMRGRDGATLRDNYHVAQWRHQPPSPEELQKRARTPVRQGGFGVETWTAGEKAAPLWLGRKFDMYGHALAALRRAPNNNLLILGALTPVRLSALANALAGLAAMSPASSIEVNIVDGLAPGLPGENLLRVGAGPLHARGAQARLVRPDQAPAILAQLAAEVTERHGGASADRSIFLVLSEPDYIPALHVVQQGFGPPPDGAPGHLRAILQRGPQVGVHVVLTASGLAAVGSILNPARELRAFTHRAVQQMNEDDSMTLFASLVGARISAQSDHPWTMLLVDALQGARAGALFKAYGADSIIDRPQDAPALMACLKSLFE